MTGVEKREKASPYHDALFISKQRLLLARQRAAPVRPAESLSATYGMWGPTSGSGQGCDLALIMDWLGAHYLISILSFFFSRPRPL